MLPLEVRIEPEEEASASTASVRCSGALPATPDGRFDGSSETCSSPSPRGALQSWRRSWRTTAWTSMRALRHLSKRRAQSEAAPTRTGRQSDTGRPKPATTRRSQTPKAVLPGHGDRIGLPLVQLEEEP